MDFVVDLQGFKKPENDFVLKELAILSINASSEEPVTLLFQLPCPWSNLFMKYIRMNFWLRRNCHGISWKSGNIPYEKASEILRNNLQHAGIIYVKGSQR